MKTSFILNSAALDPRIANQRNPHRRQSYGQRAEFVRDRILPTVLSDSYNEVLVVGVFEPGDGYEYVPLAPKYRDRRDALWQRELGFRRSTGDILVFCHDDHCPEEGFADNLRDLMNDPSFQDWDVLNPKRVHGKTGEELNNGHPKFSALDGRPEKYIEAGYCGAHCMVMRRWVPATVRWNTLNTSYWDLPQTDLFREAEAKIAWTDNLVHIDLEASDNER